MKNVYLVKNRRGFDFLILKKYLLQYQNLYLLFDTYQTNIIWYQIFHGTKYLQTEMRAF